MTVYNRWNRRGIWSRLLAALTEEGCIAEHDNHQRYHERLNSVTAADACPGRAAAIIQQRERIKRQTIEYRRLQQRKIAAKYQAPKQSPHSANLRCELYQMF